MYSIQEEADIRMFLYLVCAIVAFGYFDVKGTILIRSPDTDDMVIAVHSCPKMEHTTRIETGTTTSTTDKCHFIHGHAVYDSLTPDFCSIFPAICELTRCDSVIPVWYWGKKISV